MEIEMGRENHLVYATRSLARRSVYFNDQIVLRHSILERGSILADGLEFETHCKPRIEFRQGKRQFWPAFGLHWVSKRARQMVVASADGHIKSS